MVVGALVRLAQCIGIHRVTHNSTHYLTPVQRQIRSLLWYQICFLDFKTAEAQGPHPSVRSDDFDIPLPLNVDDDAFEFGTSKWQHHPASVQRFTDVTLSLIRYECNELHRLIFRGRIEMDRKALTLHELRAQVEKRKRDIHTKYISLLDPQIPIQRYAGLVATLLMSRCDSMLLYRHLPQTSHQSRSESENRLRDVLLMAGLTTLEIGATLETLPSLNSWAWYSSTYQQYHAVLLLLTELYRTPDLPHKDRMMTIIDHIFGHCYGVGVQERCSDLLWTVKENLEAFYAMKGVDKRKASSSLSTPQLRGRQQRLLQQSHRQHQQLHSQHPLPSLQQQPSLATDLSQFPMQPPQAQLQSPIVDTLNVDLDTLLSTGLNANNPSSTTETFEDFFAGLSSNNPESVGAIFVPAGEPLSIAGTGGGGAMGSDWMDGVGMDIGNEGGVGNGNGGFQGQWVSRLLWFMSVSS